MTRALADKRDQVAAEEDAAQKRDRQIEEDSRRRENEERVAQYNYFAARASNRSAWARAGMG